MVTLSLSSYFTLRTITIMQTNKMRTYQIYFMNTKNLLFYKVMTLIHNELLYT